MATFGLTSIGATWRRFGPGGEGALATTFILTEDGAVSSITGYVEGAADKLFSFAIYSTGATPERLGATEEAYLTPSTAWRTLNMISPLFLKAGTYNLVMNTEDAASAYTKHNGGGAGWYKALPYGAGWPETITSPNGDTAIHSIYATYEPGGGGQAIVKIINE